MTFPRRFPGQLLATLICTAPLLGGGLSGCSMPHVMGLGSYYAVTDEATGRIYYTDNLTREERGVIEFRDPSTGAWVSLKSAQVREISDAEFRAGAPR
ncbi:MAG: hypothetical protein ABL989_07080 [Gammaproteobacteria bacterium]